MQYKVTKVSEETPKEWGEGTNKTYYIKVMVDGHDKPISVGKKSPNALSAGDELNGTITPTEYDTDKFKPEPKAFTPGVKTEDPAKQDSIMRMNALNCAIGLASAAREDQKGGLDPGSILPVADKFYAWLKNEPKSGLEKARETAESLKPVVDQAKDAKSEADAMFGKTEEIEGEINLDDIPF